MVESLTYKYINGNLAQEYAANWKVESQNLPSGSTLETSKVPSQLTITVPANNTSSTRSGKIVLLQPASGKRITLNYSQPTSIQNNGIIIYVYSDPSTQGKGVIQVVADHPVASNISIVMYIQYGVLSGDKNQYNLTLAKGQLVKAIIIAITQNISEMVYAREYLCQGYQQVILESTFNICGCSSSNFLSSSLEAYLCNINKGRNITNKNITMGKQSRSIISHPCIDVPA